MTRWTCTMPLVPVAKGRGRAAVIAGRARVFTPAKTRTAEAELRYFISQNAPIHFGSQAICASFDFIFVRPKSVSAKKRPWPSVKPDWDNAGKMLSDAGNGLLWDDDAQIVTCIVRKMYGESAAVKITVWAKDRQKKFGRCG